MLSHIWTGRWWDGLTFLAWVTVIVSVESLVRSHAIANVPISKLQCPHPCMEAMPPIRKAAQRLKATPAQVLFAWLIRSGHQPLTGTRPKSGRIWWRRCTNLADSDFGNDLGSKRHRWKHVKVGKPGFKSLYQNYRRTYTIVSFFLIHFSI